MLTGFDHIAIHSQDLGRTCDFYCGVLGLAVGSRPPFVADGVWLYLGSVALVHVMQAATEANHDPSGHRAVGRSPFDHVAFAAHGLAQWLRRLDAADLVYELKRQPGTDRWQLFVHDPDGLRIEIAFDRDEAAR